MNRQCKKMFSHHTHGKFIIHKYCMCKIILSRLLPQSGYFFITRKDWHVSCCMCWDWLMHAELANERRCRSQEREEYVGGDKKCLWKIRGLEKFPVNVQGTKEKELKLIFALFAALNALEPVGGIFLSYRNRFVLIGQELFSFCANVAAYPSEGGEATWPFSSSLLVLFPLARHRTVLFSRPKAGGLHYICVDFTAKVEGIFAKK